MWLLYLDSVWTDLKLVELRSSSWTSLWAQCKSNLEASNPNILNSVASVGAAFFKVPLPACGMSSTIWPLASTHIGFKQFF